MEHSVEIDLKYASLLFSMIAAVVYFYWRLSSRIQEESKWKADVVHRVEYLESQMQETTKTETERFERVYDRINKLDGKLDELLNLQHSSDKKLAVLELAHKKDIENLK